MFSHQKIADCFFFWNLQPSDDSNSFWAAVFVDHWPTAIVEVTCVNYMNVFPNSVLWPQFCDLSLFS